MSASRVTDMYNMALETMSPGERKKYYDAKVQWVTEYAYKNAPAIRDKFHEAGIRPDQIRSVADLEKVPITIKEKLTELQKRCPPLGGFLAVPTDRVMKFFVSVGPIYGVVGTSEAFWHMMKKVFYNIGFRSGNVVLVTFSYHLVPAAWGADEALRQLGVTVIPGGVGNTEEQVEAAFKLGATGYVGTPSFLINLIQRAEKMGYDFRKDFKLTLAAVGGEPLTSSLRDELENTYGVSTHNIFGAAEVHWIGYECEHKNGMHIVEEILLEIVDPETGKQLGPGEIGEMVVTTFDETYPLVRFGLGDLACLSDEPCACGRTSPRLVKFAGRVRDVVRARARFIHPSGLKKAIESFPEVSKYQLVVSRPAHRDELTLAVELASGDVRKDELIQSLQESFKQHCLLTIDEVRFVPNGTISGEKILVDKRKWE